MATPPLYYVSRHSWKGMFRFVCKITDAKLARTFPNTVRENTMVAFDDVFEMKHWACAGSQLYNALGSERKLFGMGALVVLENVDVVWKRNERVIIFGTGSKIARLDSTATISMDSLWQRTLNDGVDGVRSLGRIQSSRGWILRIGTSRTTSRNVPAGKRVGRGSRYPQALWQASQSASAPVGKRVGGGC